MTILAAAPFAPDLAGWERVGAAEFACDAEMRRGAAAAARIRIAPEGELAYQQLRKDIAGDLLDGDEIQASVYVRSEGLDQSPGAYLALEFVGADGSRVSIAHSKASRENGSRDWERLVASGSVPKGAALVRVSLILHAHGMAWFTEPALVRLSRMDPWPDLGDRVRSVRVDPDQITQERFGGVGFHAFHHVFPATQEELDEVIYKRWRELNPSFVRMNDEWDYDRAMMDRIAMHMERMKRTGTEIYLTSWNPPPVHSDDELAAWARRVAENLEFYVRTHGVQKLKTYCMTNELTMGAWASLASDLGLFRRYHQALYDELRRRKLPVGLLATDASPESYWHTLEWAAEHMDSITAIYGGHHYFNDRGPKDERFYPAFLHRLQWAVGLARRMNKDFILGEFGAKQDNRRLDGVTQDRCVFFETPDEPFVTLQLAEAVIAALNAGVYGMGYWTFIDLPDDFAKGYINRWGVFRWSGKDRSTRAIYYGYGLLTRYLRGPGKVYAVQSDDPRVRVGALQHEPDRTWTVVVVNRNDTPTRVEIALPSAGPRADFRRYVYLPSKVTHHPFGDLPGPSGVASLHNRTLKDQVPPMSLTVYTSAYDPRPPARVTGIRASASTVGMRVTWTASRAPDLCYYRVYRIERGVPVQIRSTIAASIVDADGKAGSTYLVRAVDTSGNEGP